MESSTPPPDAVLDAPGSSCASLTPLIRARIRELASGQVLEVRSDDPAARAGVPAWSRLTGNPLEAVVEDDAERTRFYLRRK
jgi:TusA-related sulfurtransferase